MEETFPVLKHCDFLAPSSRPCGRHFVLAWVLIGPKSYFSIYLFLYFFQDVKVMVTSHYVLGIPAVNLDPTQGVLLRCALCLLHPVHTPGWEATQEIGPKVLKLNVFG